jgi:hypothetical protein
MPEQTKVNEQTNVTFSISMNLQGCKRQDTHSLEELGWDGEQGEDLQKFLQECYLDWREEQIDGGFHIEE